MKMLAAAVENGATKKAGGLLRKLRRDRRGVASVEFALLAPLLIGLYFLSMEVSQAVETSKKVSRAGAMIGDIVAQLSEVTKTDVDSIMAIGGAVLQPYYRSQPTITVTGIRITTDNPPKVLVSWSRKAVGGTYSSGLAKDSAVTVPDKLKLAGSFLVQVETKLTYTPMITWAAGNKKSVGLTNAFDTIGMGGTHYLRPRMTDAIKCSDC